MLGIGPGLLCILQPFMFLKAFGLAGIPRNLPFFTIDVVKVGITQWIKPMLEHTTFLMIGVHTPH